MGTNQKAVSSNGLTRDCKVRFTEGFSFWNGRPSYTVDPGSIARDNAWIYSFCSKNCACPTSKCTSSSVRVWELHAISLTTYLALTSVRQKQQFSNASHWNSNTTKWIFRQHKMNNYWSNICCKLLQKKNAFNVQQLLLCTHTRGVRKEFSSYVTCPNSKIPFIFLQSIFSPGLL